jgi:crotonobetainyl-CoA:carnitine CoA-transferase CaiB-like acyl-CoA transferase
LTGPLTGLRVIDCSQATAGVRLTGLLADYGADVIWVERPGGEPCRVQDPAGISVFARGKRSIELDVHDPARVDQLVDLVDRADVFVETWHPGGADSLGLGFEDLRSRNPALVYCSISAFGERAAGRDLPAYEGIVHALAGSMAAQRGHREGPIFPGFPYASIGAAHLAAIGVLACLLRRFDDGCGRHVETSLFDGALAYHSIVVGERDASHAAANGVALGSSPPEPIRTDAMRMVTRSFECADGTYLGIHTGANGAFGRLMKILELDARIPPSDTGLDFGMPLEPDQVPILSDEVPRIIASKPRGHWLDVLLANEICAVEHLRPTDVFDTPQAVHNEMTVTVDDPVLGKVEQVAPPIRLRCCPVVVEGGAPSPGHDSDSVLSTSGGWPARDPVPRRSLDTRPLLDGVRILDVGIYYAGPYASRLLADLGADVVKVEPVLGDPVRGIDVICNSANAGKSSLAANLKDPRLARARDELLRWADVVQQNLRPGVAKRLGFDDERVHALNPRAVYVSSPGWGSSGPYRVRQSFAPMLSGYVGITYEVAGRLNPPMPPHASEDPGNGLLGAVGTLLALLQRRRTGVGTVVENPQLNAAMVHLAHIVRDGAGNAVGAGRLDPLQFGFGAFERVYQAVDGWVCVVAPTATERAAFADLLGVGHVDDDERMADALAEACSTWDATTLADRLRSVGVAAAVPVPATFHHALLNDATERAMGRVVEVPDGRGGVVRELGCLLRCTDAQTAAHRAAPELGAHSAEILERFGYDGREISELRSSDAIR